MNKEKKKKSPKIAMTLKIGGMVVWLLGLASLVNNIIIFKTSIEQYIEQGYPKEMVMQAMVPSQLLPGIFEPIALYGGLGFLIFAVGVIACKLFSQDDFLEEGLKEMDEEEEKDFDESAIVDTEAEEVEVVEAEIVEEKI